MGSTLKASAPPNPALNPAELAEQPGIRECLAWFSRERQWINEQHIELCRIPAPTFLEQKRADWMLGQFRALGYEGRIDRGGNVVAHAEGESRGPFIAVTAHLDTVLAPRRPEDIKVEPDGKLRGPGVSDNGAGLAALLAIARALKSTPALENRANSVLLVANVGEEGEGNLSGMRYLCRQSSMANKIRAFLVLDGPTTDHITAQALASRRFEIVISGPGGHSWSDFGIGNPIHALSRAITLFTEAHADLPRDGSPKLSFNFGLIDGGSTINAIPTSARTKVDIRSESMDKIDEVTAALTTCVDRALQFENDRAIGGRVTAKLREIGARPGGGLTTDAPILRTVRAVDSFLGIRSHIDCASTDANIPLSMNLPAISIGAGGQGGGAHTPAEWFHPDGREVGLRRILLTLASLLREA
jgi:tripeptide aminopeptidase